MEYTARLKVLNIVPVGAAVDGGSRSITAIPLTAPERANAYMVVSEKGNLLSGHCQCLAFRPVLRTRRGRLRGLRRDGYGRPRRTARRLLRLRHYTATFISSAGDVGKTITDPAICLSHARRFR